MKKRILYSILFVICSFALKAQNDCTIPMMVMVSNQAENVPSTAQTALVSKMRQLVTAEGMEGGAKFSNFGIIANVVENSKEILHGSRPLVTLTVELELFVGNNYTGEKISSTVVTLNGAGRDENKAYTNAFQSLNPRNQQFKTFLKETKKEINNYYQKQLPAIIRQAKTYAIRHEYEEAICLLTSIPTCCNRYEEVEKCMLSVFQDYINYDCAIKIAKARSIWNAGQDKASAILSGAYLAAIDPSSSCNGDAIALSEAIRLRIGDDWEFTKEMHREGVALEKARIEAMRAIGVAYGENQKAKTISEHWIVD